MTACSSPAMESKAAAKICCRSERLNKLKYATYVGEGDSKGDAVVTNAEPYGPDVQVAKQECIGHAQKLLGTALRTLKKKKGKQNL